MEPTYQGLTESQPFSSQPRIRRRLMNQLLFRIVAVFVFIWIIVCLVFVKHFFQGEASISPKFPWDNSLDFRTRMNQQQKNKEGNQVTTNNIKLQVNQPPAPMGYNQMILTVPLFYNKQIRIQLRSDWSQGSVDYINRLVEEQCATCSFFRIVTNRKEEKEKGILLGTLQNDKVPLNIEPGTCPDDMSSNSNDDECHGPILQRGMVGWVGGTVGGPEFFLNLYNDPLTDLGSKHTVFGQVVDYESFDLLEEFLDEDTSYQESQVLNDVIHFHLELE